MSRVGKKPIIIPEKTKVVYKDKVFTAEGAKGKLSQKVHDDIDVDIKENNINIIMNKEDRKTHALHGLTRALIANVVTGVSIGFERTLEINGIGYRAEAKGDTVVFNIGYSHPINFKLPEGVKAEVKKSLITLYCCDKEKLGKTAASIRSLRLPEPYKGKGIKYKEEYIKRKAGKSGAAA
jgi:large subunit ribosomal protein L6